MTVDELIERLLALKKPSHTSQLQGDERVVLVTGSFLGDMEAVYPTEGLVMLHSNDALPSVQHLALQEAKLDKILKLLENG